MQTYSKLLKQGQKISKLKLGNKTINLAYLGNINIKTAYLGSQLVIGNNEKYYRINVDLRNTDYNLDKYIEARRNHKPTEPIPLYIGDRFEIAANGPVYLYTYGLGSKNYILDAVSDRYIYPNNTDTNGINISKNLYGYNYNCYYNKHGIKLYYKQNQSYFSTTCYGGNAIGFTISCSKQTYMDDGTTLTYQELPMDSQKIRLSYTAPINSTEYSITKMTDLNQSFVKFSYECKYAEVLPPIGEKPNEESLDTPELMDCIDIDMKPNEEEIPSNVSSKLLSYVLEVDVDKEFAENDYGGTRFIENTFDIIWEIDNATFTLPIYHIHTAYKPIHFNRPTPTEQPEQYYNVTVNYIFKTLSSNYPYTEFYVHLYYNGKQINNSNELLRCRLNNYNNDEYVYIANQIIEVRETIYNKLYSGAKDVFTFKFEDSLQQEIYGHISQNRMTNDGYIIELTNIKIKDDNVSVN